MAETAAARIGVTFPMVPSGVAAYPVMSAGASGVPRGRTQAVTEGTYSVTVVEAKPTRLSVYGIYSIEDELRLPGLAEAIARDQRAQLLESMDKAIFIGDSGANENTADIAGLTTAVGELGAQRWRYGTPAAWKRWHSPLESLPLKRRRRGTAWPVDSTSVSSTRGCCPSPKA